MGLLDRILGRQAPPAAGGARRGPRITAPPDYRYTGRLAPTLGGDVRLDVVGESYRQDTLWRLVGGRRAEPVRLTIVAVLEPEDNEYDANAVRVLIDGRPVGYLSRENAARYRPGVEALVARDGLVALAGVIAGGGQRPDGLGPLGVILEHDPADFGLAHS